MEEIKYSAQLAGAMKEMLDKGEFKYDFYEDRGVFRFGLGLGKDQKMQGVNIWILIHEDSISSYAAASIKADEAHLSAVAEFIARANYGLRMGNFEMDYKDGEVRYKCHNRFEDRVPSDAELWFITVRCPESMWRRYGNAFLKVIFGDVSPEDAIAEAEKRQE